jgi:glyoxylase-like metal-dependent hydrolase (beta-lactamase superfamily II)
MNRLAHLSLVALLSLSATACGQMPSAIAQPAQSAAHAQAQRSLGVFTSDASGFDTHTYWYDTGREVVVFDAQFTPELAQKAIAAIRAATRSPITYLVITHPNPDKFNGASAFQAIGAKVVASEATAQAIPGVHAYKKNYFVNVAKMFTEATYPAQAHVDITFKDQLKLPLQGGAVVTLRRLQHEGVSTTQTVASIPALKALVVGDLVHVKAHAWLEGGIQNGQPHPDLASWKLALNELLAYKGATVYGGRGLTAPVADAVAQQSVYLTKMEGIVRQYLADHQVHEADLMGPQAGVHYQAIAALASQAFPDYALPYMISYGVYGLAMAIAQP